MRGVGEFPGSAGGGVAWGGGGCGRGGGTVGGGARGVGAAGWGAGGLLMSSGMTESRSTAGMVSSSSSAVVGDLESRRLLRRIPPWREIKLSWAFPLDAK